MERLRFFSAGHLNNARVGGSSGRDVIIAEAAPGCGGSETLGSGAVGTPAVLDDGLRALCSGCFLGALAFVLVLEDGTAGVSWGLVEPIMGTSMVVLFATTGTDRC